MSLQDKLKKVSGGDKSFKDRLTGMVNKENDGFFKEAAGAAARFASRINPVTAVASAITAVGVRDKKKPEISDEQKENERVGQTDTNRRMGYRTDENSNITGTMSEFEFREEFGEDVELPRSIAMGGDEGREARLVTNSTAPEFTKDDLTFQEEGVGSGIPVVKTADGYKNISDIYKTFELPEQANPIKRIVINDPDEGEYIIDTPEKLAIANTIKSVADKVAPEYTEYLLKLAQKEGIYKADQFRGEKKNPGGGDDQGIFQINSKFFPSVTQEMANDVVFSTLWAISLINSQTPVAGDGKRTGQEKWIANEAVKRSSITIE